MREIKFRFWSRLGVGMTYWEELKEPIEIKDFQESDNFKVMQYTGLKDKNGKEIYEGDIVLIESEEKDVITDAGEGPIEQYNQLLPVVFENGAFGVNTESDYMFTIGFHTFKDIENNSGQTEFEIIGNIYENPELLSN